MYYEKYQTGAIAGSVFAYYNGLWSKLAEPSSAADINLSSTVSSGAIQNYMDNAYQWSVRHDLPSNFSECQRQISTWAHLGMRSPWDKQPASNLGIVL